MIILYDNVFCCLCYAEKAFKGGRIRLYCTWYCVGISIDLLFYWNQTRLECDHFLCFSKPTLSPRNTLSVNILLMCSVSTVLWLDTYTLSQLVGITFTYKHMCCCKWVLNLISRRQACLNRQHSDVLRYSHYSICQCIWSNLQNT